MINKKIKSLMLLALSILVSIGLFAQVTLLKKDKQKPKLPPWVSEKGYWVVESNIHSPKTHIVWFYNNENVLMYKEKLEGVRLDAESRRVKMKLKKALEISAANWHNAKNGLTKNDDENQSIVKAALR